MSRYSEQKIRFCQERNQKERINNVTNKSKKTTKIHTLLNYLNWKTFKWTDQKENLMKQIHKKNNQKNWRIFWNENCKKIIIVSRTDLYVICNKKKNDKMTSW